MYRSGSRSWQFLSLCALVVLVLAASTRVQPAAAQAGGVDQEAAMHYSLYYENFKNENYKDALPDLHWILDNAPGFLKKKDTNFDRAVTAYKALAEQETDAAMKRVYLDSVLAMFDRAVPAIQGIGGEIDEFQWTRDKGRFIQQNLDALEDQKGVAIEAYRKAYDLDPARLDPYYLDVLISDYYTNGDIGGALDFLRELKDTRGDEEGVENLIRKYFAVIPPEEQIAFLEEQMEADPENVEVIQQLFELYQQEEYHGKMMELAPKMLALDPTPGVLRLLTRMYLQDGDVDQAASVFNQMKNTPGVEMMAQDYHNMGIAQQEMENFGEAKSYYQQALQIDPEYKAALKAIADLYATAVSRCGVKDREQAAVFWLIADAYNRAGDGNGAARMRSAFPTAEDIFYVQKWTNGGTTSVSYGCRGLSISGTTTVRQR